MPRLRNLFTDPRATITRPRRDSPRGDSGSAGLQPNKTGSAGLQPASERELDVHVDGLACVGICARRTQEGLSSLPGVRTVSFNPANDTFTVRYRGDAPDERSVAAAVRGKVVCKPARKLLDWLGRALRLAGSAPE